MSAPDRRALADLVPAALKDGGAPVFAEPWQAQAFAMTVTLHQRGRFTWTEWADALAAEVRHAGANDGDGARYYELWLAALEKLVTAKGLASPSEVDAATDAWRDAYLHTPHGQPVELPAAD